MSIIEYTGPSNPQEIRKYLMRRTKDEIVWEYLRQWREYGELEKERDALAAHVGQLAGPLAHVLDQFEKHERGEELNSDEDAIAWAEEARAALADTPTTSLDRLKAEWQAEALEGIASYCRAVPQAAATAQDVLRIVEQRTRAARRQAEGEAHD